MQSSLAAVKLEGSQLWTVKRSPLLPAEEAFHHPDRCMNCGHLGTEHDPQVGCTAEGGGKYIEDEAGNGKHACGCTAHVQEIVNA